MMNRPLQFGVALGAWCGVFAMNAAAAAPVLHEVRKFRADDSQNQDRFGFSVDIDDGVAIVGAPGAETAAGLFAGAAYLFDVETGVQLRKLEPLDADEYDNFGNAVAIDGGLAAVAADRAGPGIFTGAGAVYVFDVATGQQLV